MGSSRLAAHPSSEGAESAAAARGPSRFEQLKAGSGHLLEPLLAERDSEPRSFTESAVQILKFHGSYQQDDRDNRRKGEEKDWQMMLRLRSPGGRIPVPL
ncbi:MAG: sulfite reductase, ferredoxin dependent, partial [Cyanobium sp.]